MKNKIRFITKLINTLPSHLKSWYEFASNGRNNHIAIYSFGLIYPEDVDYILKRTHEIIKRMDKSTMKHNPWVKKDGRRKIITLLNNVKREYLA